MSLWWVSGLKEQEENVVSTVAQWFTSCESKETFIPQYHWNNILQMLWVIENKMLLNITEVNEKILNLYTTLIETLDGGGSWCPPWHQQGTSISHGLCRKCEQVNLTESMWGTKHNVSLFHLNMYMAYEFHCIATRHEVENILEHPQNKHIVSADYCYKCLF